MNGHPNVKAISYVPTKSGDYLLDEM